MKTVPFCHLHFHTQYSLLDSACKVGEIMETAKALGQEYVAMTDHGNLYGAVEFYKKAYSAGIKPIIGCEVYVARNGMDEKSSQADNMHLVLLAENNKGYENLMKLVSKAHLEGFYYKPRIDKKLLREYSGGIIGLSACLKGEVTEAAAAGDVDKAVALAHEYSEILGPNNFYLELQDHGMPEQKEGNRHMLEVARITGLPLVVTNDVHYIKQTDHEAHDVLICLQQGHLLTDENRMRYPGNQFYMKSGAEMQQLFPDQPEALANTIEIAKRCNVEFEFDLPAERLHFPAFFPLPEGVSKEDHLMEIGKRELEKLYNLKDFDHPEDELGERVKKQYEYEVGIIKQTNYVNYFLVVADFIRWAKENDIPVGPGRGSGAGSILAYALGITAIDPLKYNLIFERFLNPDRVSPPDFDIDFCPTKRQAVIQYVREKYGEDCVAQIITFGTLGAKTLMRDIGRVLDLPLSECDKVAKLIPDMTKNLQTAQKDSPDFALACRTDPTARAIMKYAPRLEGLPRHTGMHAAGVVIGEKPLIDIIPLTRERKEGMTVVQFEKGPTEEIGLLKMDFLGLKNLTIIQEAIDHIEANHGIKIDPMELPLDDEKTFDLFCRGDTAGVFQLESPGMRDTLRQMNPDCFEDIIAVLALYRPGPMQFIPTYNARKHGKEKVKYDHPILEPILKETNGIIVYQEQIQQAARDLAGFSLGEGDILRRAMGKKKKEVMDEQRSYFVEGCKKTNSIEEKLANRIFDNIAKFAEYGFNKSHSTAYGFVSFQTAYLKAHYPEEFMAALLSAEMGNPDKLAGVLSEVKEMGIEIRPPSVNESIARFRPTKGAIHFGMAGIKGVGGGAVDALVSERDANGPYEGLIDFCSRVDSQALNRKALENLIKCGAFDFTGIHRSRLFEGIGTALARAAEAAKDRASGQGNMFDMLGGGETEETVGDEELPDAAPWHENEMLSTEKELIGFYVSGHPLAAHEWTLKTFALQRIGNLEEYEERLSKGEKEIYVRLGGLVDQYRKMFTKKDPPRPYARFVIEGLDGAINAVVWPDDFQNLEPFLDDGKAIMVGAKIALDFRDSLEVQVSEIIPLTDAGLRYTKKVSIHLTEASVTEERLKTIQEIAKRNPGLTPLSICILLDSGEKVFVKAHRDYYVEATQQLGHELEQLLGEDCVKIVSRQNPLLRPPARRKWQKRG
ncbi:DNA polymerase III subunit alpha [Tichowtungia aerotolerans]|uniref:DNA polymerase III subunit alpha n=1 Tax=Tichowtungia aerotolerans TaxID=2697043 RepID=A0A6P1MER2_9BACT|nr:DNA polymerase III subunit alpha [Tichowtungia aerotolerans]QHI69575.1 DNA polymerase III subunit alpha [Tichowtungia aerotolerans]